MTSGGARMEHHGEVHGVNQTERYLLDIDLAMWTHLEALFADLLAEFTIKWLHPTQESPPLRCQRWEKTGRLGSAAGSI